MTFSSCHHGICFQFLAGSSYKFFKCLTKCLFFSDIWSLVSNIELLNALGFPGQQEYVCSVEMLCGLMGRDWSPERIGHKQKHGTLRYHPPIIQKGIGGWKLS